MKRIAYLILAVALLAGAGFTWQYFSKPQLPVAGKPGTGPARALPVKAAAVGRGKETASFPSLLTRPR